MNNSKLNILIVGTGMYVCGRGTEEYGTILPAICEWERQGRDLGQIYIAGTNPDSIEIVKSKLNQLNRLMGSTISPIYFPTNIEDKNSYQKALQEIPQPACAIISVPDHIHYEVTSNCLDAGLHTLVVKPLTPTVEENRSLISLQEKRGLYGAVEFHKRFDRANLKLKHLLNEDRLGALLYIIVEYSQRNNIPSENFLSWVDKTNIFQYLGIHYADIIFFATGATPRRAMANGQYGLLNSQGIEVFDAIQGIIEWETKNGHKFLSYIMTNWIDPQTTSSMSDQKIKLIGTKGRYESDQKSRGIMVVTDTNGIEEPNPDFCSIYPVADGTVSYQGYGIDSIHTFIQDILDLNQNKTTIEKLEHTRPSFRQALPSTAVVESINESLNNNGGWVSVEY